MADWTREVVTSTQVRYRIPAGSPYGADWSEVYNAIQAAVRECQGDRSESPGEDAVRVRVHGEDDTAEVIVSFELNETTEPQSPVDPDGRTASERLESLRKVGAAASDLLGAVARTAGSGQVTQARLETWVREKLSVEVPPEALYVLAEQLANARMRTW